MELIKQAELNQPLESMPTLRTIREAIITGKSKKALKDMRIPARYANKGFIKFAQSEKALEAIRDGRGVFVSGCPGAGKTHLAIALMELWLADNLDEKDGTVFSFKGVPTFLPAIEFWMEIKQSWQRTNGDMSELDVVEKYEYTPLLCIDDLGAEKESEGARQIFYLLIDRRYRDCKQTIITSNLTLDELAQRFDDRIASRIAEMGITITLPEKDWRLQNRTAKIFPQKKSYPESEK